MNHEILYQTALKLVQKNHTLDNGNYPSTLPSVGFFYANNASEIQHGMCEAGIAFIFSGAKYGVMGAQHYRYDNDNAILVNARYPVAYHIEATPAAPLLGMYITISRNEVAQFFDDLAQIQPVSGWAQSKEEESAPIAVCPLNDDIREAVWMLLRTLDDPMKASLFGAAHIRAILYAVYTSGSTDAQNAMHRWVQQDGAFAQFQKATQYIQHHYARAMTLSELTSHVGMSASSLNRCFHRYVADSPLQYLKKIRLNAAKEQLMHGGQAVQNVALDVGYESGSQFSREFKRYFGYNPQAVKKS